MHFFDEEYPNPFVAPSVSREGKDTEEYVRLALDDAYIQLRREFTKLLPMVEDQSLGFYIEHKGDRSFHEAGIVLSDGYNVPLSSYSFNAPYITELGIDTTKIGGFGLLFRQFTDHISKHVFISEDEKSLLSKNPLWMTVLWWRNQSTPFRIATRFGYSFKKQDRFNNSGTPAFSSGRSSNVHLWAKELNERKR